MSFSDKRNMKRLIKIIAVSLFLSGTFASISAKEAVTETKDLYDYNNIVYSLEKPEAPVIKDDYVIFTYQAGPRFVGIAFDFEDYTTIHSFQLKNTRDFEGKITNSILFYLLDKPKGLSEIKYRLVIDGLWTADPSNPNKFYDPESGISLSKVKIDSCENYATYYKKDSGVTFVYKGEEGLNVRLAGNFTNWDSWIYELEETQPGLYTLNIPLPEGTYYYNYYLGMTSVVDKTNPNRAYTQEGRTASVITVN